MAFIEAAVDDRFIGLLVGSVRGTISLLNGCVFSLNMLGASGGTAPGLGRVLGGEF